MCGMLRATLTHTHAPVYWLEGADEPLKNCVNWLLAMLEGHSSKSRQRRPGGDR